MSNQDFNQVSVETTQTKTNVFSLMEKRKSKGLIETATAPLLAASSNSGSTSKIIRSEDLEAQKSRQVQEFHPQNLMESNPTITDLKSNIVKLQDLHSKLRFMLKELEDLVQK